MPPRELLPGFWRRACLVFVVMAFAVATGDAWADARRELVFLNWDSYVDPALIRAFEKRYDVRVREMFFESDEARNRMLVEADGKGYDVAVVNGDALSLYRAHSWLAPLDKSLVANLRHVDPLYRTIYPAADGVAVPYFWGTLGIAYRADLLPAGIRTWKQFFEPDEALHRKISTLASPAELIGMALKAGGQSANSADPAALAEAAALLLRQKPFVRSYFDVAVDEDSALLSGELVASMMYNGDALVLAEQNPHIRYTVPEEGAALWVDYLAVMAAPGNRDLAYAFVNFLNDPANAAQNALRLHYATPNMAAEPLLPTAFLANPAIFPPLDVMARCEVIRPLPAQVERRKAMIYARLVD